MMAGQAGACLHTMAVLHTRLNLLRDQEISRGKEIGGSVSKVIPRRTQVLGAAAKEPSTSSSPRQQQKQSVISQAHPQRDWEPSSESPFNKKYGCLQEVCDAAGWSSQHLSDSTVWIWIPCQDLRCLCPKLVLTMIYTGTGICHYDVVGMNVSIASTFWRSVDFPWKGMSWLRL